MKKESPFSEDNKIWNYLDINQKHVAHSKIDLVTASEITHGTNKTRLRLCNYTFNMWEKGRSWKSLQDSSTLKINTSIWIRYMKKIM